MATYFAPAERTERRKFRNQLAAVSRSPLVNSMLLGIAGLLVVINEDRQIVALNSTFLEALGIDDPDEALGLRLGESLHCIHAFEQPGGCGTSSYCSTCGAVIAMMTALQRDVVCEKVCSLTVRDGSGLKDICLLVRAMPLEAEGQRWIVIFARDITQEVYRANLENVFFHDINNIITALLGGSSLMWKKHPSVQEAVQIHDIALRLASEVSLQRTLSHGAQDAHVGYSRQSAPVSLEKIVTETKLILQGHKALQGKNIRELHTADVNLIHTDVLLVSRVLSNMLINASEATVEGGEFNFISRREGDSVVWEVWNEAYIPENIQKRIFQRHFSTKQGPGRGFGTYSMKLFAEHYLDGSISFSSTAENGTLFSLRLPMS